MWPLVIRRLIFLPFLWLAVTLVIFALLQPLGPYQRLSLYVQANPESMSLRLRPEEMQRLIQKYGLDEPFHVQYLKWLGQVLQGNLGWSKTAQAPVLEAFKQRLPATMELTLFAIGPMLLVAIWMGIHAAVRYKRPTDHFIRGITITGYSLPSFVFAIFALVVFYGLLNWFPPGRLSLWAEQLVYSSGEFQRYTGLMTVDGILNGRLDVTGDAARHLILPIITLAYISWAGLTQVTRSSMLDAMSQDYVTTARAKGVPERQVIYKHVRRNAMIPVTTISVGATVGLLLGVFITETVFNIKGLGSWSVQAAQSFDVPAVLGVTLFTSSLIVLGNLVADVLYTVVDPRIRYS